MSNKKHYIVTSITLGLIAAASGLLIAGTNLITKDRIAQNEKDKVSNGIKAIFNQNTVKVEEFTLENAGLSGEYKYVNYLYNVNDSADTNLGVALRTTGSNMYGKISLIVGFTVSDHAFKNLSVVVNEQTYATTLVDNYINPLNGGTRDLEDVSCGATYGAKLVRDMVKEAKQAAEEYWS
ncbi:MAG: hypothetical protein K5906_01885 [Bacilli bacterium]|nr:hypothetical protein [Bacilli bacterium]